MKFLWDGYQKSVWDNEFDFHIGDLMCGVQKNGVRPRYVVLDKEELQRLLRVEPAIESSKDRKWIYTMLLPAFASSPVEKEVLTRSDVRQIVREELNIREGNPGAGIVGPNT